jgi:predicted Rossmann-fold nucleotide-binding protein
MGAIADATYKNGGSVFGIIPRALMAYERKPSEVGPKTGLDNAIRSPTLLQEASSESRSVFCPVKTMHHRKQ